LRLKDLNYSTKQISEIVRVPLGELKNFIAKRITYATSGKEIVLKAPLKHMANKDTPIQDFAEDLQTGWNGNTQGSVLDEVIELLESDLIDLENRGIVRKLNKIHNLIENLIEENKYDNEEVEVKKGKKAKDKKKAKEDESILKQLDRETKKLIR
jgi:hypothetical protein